MPLPQPDLPEPAHAHLDSMLSRKFGKEIANYFSGSPLNRVSFLRTDHSFLSAALKHPSTSFLLFRDLNPIVASPTQLGTVSYKDVEPVIGADPYAKTEEDLINEYNSSTYIPQLIFLGLDERARDSLVWKDIYRGAPFFALDITPKDPVTATVSALLASLEPRGLAVSKGRMHLSLPAPEAAIYAEARHMLDWNLRNPFCAACGYATLSVNAGFKRTCPPRDMADKIAGSDGSGAPKDRPPCATRSGISNLSFPRTDPTVIMAVVSPDARKLLLGRQKKWPPHWYSTLAGFVEPAESVEEAVRREVWEESGILLGRVVVHSTQPWPYPANLMIGAIAQAIPGGETVNLGNDAELESARWFELEEIREALRVGTSGLGEEPGPEYKEGGLRLPPQTAIAHQLMAAVVDGFVSGDSKI